MAMLFLVPKSTLPPNQLRYHGYVYALLTGPPPIPRPRDMDADEAIKHGAVPLSALPRTKWKHRSTHKDIKENGVITRRQGITDMRGELFWKGKFVQPEIRLEFTWEYTLDPDSGKYFLTHAELEDGSSHELVDENGQPTSLKGALFTIRHALGKNPMTAPEPLPRYASVKYDGHAYHRVARTVHDLTPDYLKQMQPNDWVRVYHATAVDSHDSSGPQSMVFGIDALGKQRSKYHPNSPGGYSYSGLYVGPTRDSVGQFGRLVFEIAVKPKNLHPTDWSARTTKDTDRFDHLKDRCAREYPDSFNPLLSGALSTDPRDECGNAIRGHEPQALFKGIAQAKDILSVEYVGKTYTPQEFIEAYKSDLGGWEGGTKKDPKSTRLSWDDYVGIIRSRYDMDIESIVDSLFMEYTFGGEEKVFYMLKQLAPFSESSAQKLWRMIQHRYCDRMQDTWNRIKELRPELELGEAPACPAEEYVPRAASVVRYAGRVYRLAAAEEFIAEVNAGKSRWPGVEIDVRSDDYSDDVAELANLRIKDLGARSQGTGSAVLGWITSLADAHDVTLKLHVEPFGEDAPPKTVIKRFYRGHCFHDRKQNWMERRPRTAQVSRVATPSDEYLYHVTYVNQLPGISSAGLNPGAGGSFGGGSSGYAGNSAGRIFWTEPAAIGFWMDRKGDMAENEADHPIDDGLIPIVLRRDGNLFEEELYDDEAGSTDAPDYAYYTEDAVLPSELEVWDGHAWTPVIQARVDALIKQAYDAADIEIVDGEEIVYMDSEYFLP